jgi:hypothetical protein
MNKEKSIGLLLICNGYSRLSGFKHGGFYWKHLVVIVADNCWD